MKSIPIVCPYYSWLIMIIINVTLQQEHFIVLSHTVCCLPLFFAIYSAFVVLFVDFLYKCPTFSGSRHFRPVFSFSLSQNRCNNSPILPIGVGIIYLHVVCFVCFFLFQLQCGLCCWLAGLKSTRFDLFMHWCIEE